MTDFTRRRLFTGLGVLLAAPVIVRASSIMPVRSIDPMADLLAAMNRAFEEMKARIVDDVTKIVWAGDAIPAFGFEALEDKSAFYGMAPAAYAWKNHSSLVKIG